MVLLIFPEFELPKGCRIVTVFLTDEEYHQLRPLDRFARRHCKLTDFSLARATESCLREESPVHRQVKASRRQTCPEISLNKPQQPVSSIALQTFIKKSPGREAGGPTDRPVWSRAAADRSVRTSLSAVPIVECEIGEMLHDSDSDVSERDVTHHPTSLTSGKIQDGELTSSEGEINPGSLRCQNEQASNKYQQSVPEKFPVKSKHTETRERDEPSISDLEDDDIQNQNGDKLKQSTAIEDRSEFSYPSRTASENMSFHTHGEDCALDLSVSESKGKSSVVQSSEEERSLRSYDNIPDTDTEVLATNGMHSVVRHSPDIHASIEPVKSSGSKFDGSKSNAIQGSCEGKVCEDKNDKLKLNIKTDNVSPDSLKISPVLLREESEFETEDESFTLDHIRPCINCLEQNDRRARCENCIASYNKQKMFGVLHSDQEILDFKNSGRHRYESGNETEGQTDTEHGVSGSQHPLSGLISSLSSDVSTDSTISRFWTSEMDGLTDVSLYVQCHADIALLLLLDNPDHSDEALFHSLVCVSHDLSSSHWYAYHMICLPLTGMRIT